MAFQPLWKDCEVQLTQGDYSDFRIKTGGTVIYEGRSYRRPGMGFCTAKINDVCADHIASRLTGAVGDNTVVFPVTYTVEVYDDVGAKWVTTDIVDFVPDWSYIDADLSKTCSAPINGHFDRRMPLPWSKYDKTNVTAVITDTAGQKTSMPLTYYTTADFNNDFNSDYQNSGDEIKNTYMLRIPEAIDPVTVVIDNYRTFRALPPCNRFALYYVNAFGGWDAFLIEGNYKINDTLKRYTAQREISNRDSAARGTINYVNEITRGITFNTCWLSDDEAGRMHHLLNSTDVFLYDLADSKFTPVVLTGTSTEYKTFRNNGHRMVNYAITAEVAQERLRR